MRDGADEAAAAGAVLRLLLDDLVGGYSDFNWLTPWEKTGFGVSRLAHNDNGDAVGFYVIEEDSYRQVVMLKVMVE